MVVKLCDNKAQWVQAPPSQGKLEFLQSWEWGEFQRSVGHGVLRLRLEEAGGVVAQVQGFVHQLGPGLKYLYSPRCEVGVERYVDEICDYLKKLGFIFWRVEPLNQLSIVSYLVSPIVNRQPQHTLIIDLQKSAEGLLSAMHPKTRYNIHLAEKKGVSVSLEKNAGVFWKLNVETTSRDAFKSHDKIYYERMLSSPLSYQLTAYLGNTPIASNIFINHDGTFTYLHGASSNTARNLMAPYLLQWEGIKMAKQLGCKYYDFWGVAPLVGDNSGDKRDTGDTIAPTTCFHNYCWEAAHAWTGVTRFKAGFSGEAKTYPQAQEIIFQPVIYKLYKLAKRFL
jgi:lipid II:glycine glycyltransferase (peptidoglycan interpeptide bridge formation enzyme)